MLKRTLLSLVLLVGMGFGLVGCASNEAKSDAMTGETETHSTTPAEKHWSQP